MDRAGRRQLAARTGLVGLATGGPCFTSEVERTSVLSTVKSGRVVTSAATERVGAAQLGAHVLTVPIAAGAVLLCAGVCVGALLHARLRSPPGLALLWLSTFGLWLHAGLRLSDA